MTEKYICDIKLSRPVDKSSYLSRLPVVRYLAEKGSLPLTRDVTFFVGENGTGKSTLIEAVAAAYGFNPEGGSRNFSFSTAEAHSELWKHLTLVRNRYPKDGFFLRAESFFNVATYIDELDSIPAASPPIIGGYGGDSLHGQSHGESFLALVQNRFFGKGLYILDEPEAALSPMRLMTLIAEMGRLCAAESQFIIATHSPILMAYPNAQIYLLEDSGVRSVSYRETEHYTVTRRFLENPEKMMKLLLEE